MKIIYPLISKKELPKIEKYIDGLVLGTSFSLRMTSAFSIEEIKDIASTTNKEIFVNVDQLYVDCELLEVEKFLKELISSSCFIIFSDWAIYEIALKYQFEHRLIYNSSTLVANYEDFNLLYELNLYGAFLSKELVLEDILEIGNKKRLKLFLIGFGYLNMFHSKRALLKNYFQFHHQPKILSNKYYLKEELRLDKYPIVEDNHGTHIFRSKIFSNLNYLKNIEHICDYLFIDNYLIHEESMEEVLEIYAKKKAYEKLNELFKEELDEGFLKQKTIYKKGD